MYDCGICDGSHGWYVWRSHCEWLFSIGCSIEMLDECQFLISEGCALFCRVTMVYDVTLGKEKGWGRGDNNDDSGFGSEANGTSEVRRDKNKESGPTINNEHCQEVQFENEDDRKEK